MGTKNFLARAKKLFNALFQNTDVPLKNFLTSLKNFKDFQNTPPDPDECGDCLLSAHAVAVPLPVQWPASCYAYG